MLKWGIILVPSKMKKQLNKSLLAIESNKIITLFENKNWVIDETNKSSLFNRFVKRYMALKSKEQKDMFLSIAKDYHLLSLEDYSVLLLQILNEIFQNEKRKDVLVFPLSTRKDVNRIKSGVFVSYLFKSVFLKYYDNLHKKNFTIIDDYIMLEKKINKNKTLVLIDDYIGSGNQGSRALNDILKTVKKEKDSAAYNVEHIYIISLVINQKGKDKINKQIKDLKNVTLHYGIKTVNRVFEYEPILKEMEEYRDLDKTYLGFEDCADLVTLVRTPNNTIPLFRKGLNSAPFPRIGK